MTSIKRIVVLLNVAFLATACGSTTTVGSLGIGSVNAVLSGANVMSVSVGAGGACDPNNSYINEPCVAVTICSPGTSTCQTINNILLDTGSYGLRIFSSVLTSVTLTQVLAGSEKQVAECASFGSGSTWGPVQTAGIVLGQEPTVTLPIQVINSSYASTATGKSLCSNDPQTPPYSSPAEAGYNGILGVGVLNYDCGTDCVTDANNGMYYACNGTSCTNIVYPLALQITNPVTALPTDHNGSLLVMPNLASTGANGPIGSFAMGIGTQSNNNPTGKTTFTADAQADFTVAFNGQSFSGFIDSGSNGYFLQDSSLATCTDASDFFCPSGLTNLAATNTGTNGTSASSPFQIGNSDTLFNTNNTAFNNLGGSASGLFDWGLPFFFGRYVFIGISGQSSAAGSGPFWAY